MLARVLAMGIESKVDDIVAVYGKMAILKHNGETHADTFFEWSFNCTHSIIKLHNRLSFIFVKLDIIFKKIW
jgi:hypothetical protein